MNRSRILTFPVLAALAALGCSDTARGATTLNVTPPTSTTFPLLFNVPSNSVSQSQTVQVNTTDGSTPSVVIQVNQTWLNVSPGPTVNISPAPTSLNVRVNTQGLAQGSYQGMVTITVSGQPSNTVSFNVSLTVSGTSALSANPSTVTFSALQGAQSGSPSSINVVVSSNGPTLNYGVSSSTSDGGSWLLLSNISGRQTGDSGFTVQVNPSTLSPGTYTGTITAQSTTTNDSVQISVSLTVSANATLTVTPSNPPPFLWQTTTANPSPQSLTVTSSGGTINFNVRVSPTVTWLVVSPLSGQAGSSSSATINLNPTPNGAGLQPGQQYTTNVIFSVGGTDVATVPVKLVVSQNPLIQLSNNSLAYTAQFASAQSPADQQVSVTASNSGSVGFNFTSSVAWLTAKVTSAASFTTTGSSTAPDTLTIRVNASSLAVGTYNGSITVQPTNGDQYSEFINVSLTVSAASTLTAGPGQLLFSFQTTQNPPPAQQVQIGSTGQPIIFAITTVTSSCGNNWLNYAADSSVTPATLTVGVVTTGMTPGTCSGTVRLNYNSGAGPATLLITVTVAVSSSSELEVSVPSGFGFETVQAGSGALQRNISLTSTDPMTPVTFTASATSVPGGWLLVGAAGFQTPQNLSIQIVPTGLAPGVYNGTISINSASLPMTSLTLSVTLTVTPNVSVTVAPASLSFNEAQGGSPPASQNLTLTSSGGSATFTSSIQYNNGNNWLQVTPSSGSAGGAIQVAVQQNSLSQGDYTAVITLAFQGAATTSTTVNVTLHVGPAQSVSVSATSLSFAYQLNGTPPPSQKITVAGTGGAQFTVGTTSTGWLSVDATSGTVPKDINVSVITSALTQPGTLNGSITISSSALTSPITISVTLTIAAAPTPQPVKIVSAASGVAGVIAAGEIITITGNQLGPASPSGGVSFHLNPQGGVDPNLAGVRVLFDNNPGTPIFVSAGQINVIVPYEVNGRISTTMVVEYQGVQSAAFQLAVGPAALGLFTDNFSGAGQVAAINQNGTYNGVGAGFTPAPQGSEIQIYATGGGQTNPPSTTGSVTPIPTSSAGPFYRIPGTVTATVGGQPATVDFAGAAPGLVTGAVQFNVHLPLGVSGNAVPIVITINGIYSSPLGTTIAISNQ